MYRHLISFLTFHSIFIQSLWTIVGAVLHMGNISFQANDDGQAAFAPPNGNHGNIEVFAKVSFFTLDK